MQEVIHTAHHAGSDGYSTARHLEVSNIGDPTGYFLRYTHTYMYKHVISGLSVHFSSVSFTHFYQHITLTVDTFYRLHTELCSCVQQTHFGNTD
jgi:hypothetical protein